MTLGEHPDGVDPRFLISLDQFQQSEFDIGRFRDIGHAAGVNRLNQAGGAIMDDFDNDGLLDLVVTTFDPTAPMAFYRNKGDGTFEDRTKAARLTGQLGGLNCVQTDYNNDGHMDIFIPRGAWLQWPDAADPAAEQRQRHVHRRHRRSRPARPGQLELRRLGRLRQRRLARPVRLLRARSRTGCTATRETARSRRSLPKWASLPASRRAVGDGSDNATAHPAERLVRQRPLRRPDVQRGRLDRLRQRRLLRTCSSTTSPDTRGCSTTTATGPSPTRPRRWASTAPRQGSRAGPGTTTTTAGSTSSPPATTARWGTWSRGCSASRTSEHSNRLYRNLGGKGFEDVTRERRPGHGLRHDGQQLRRLRQRRLSRHLPGHRRPAPLHAGPQPHVQERRRPALRRDHRPRPAPGTCRRGTASPAATGTATATSTSSSRWAAPCPATSTTTSCSRTPARATTG